jgi:trans-aconitate methyltransferase
MAESFPVGKTSSIEEIALACGMHKDDTRRIINHAKTNGLFQETEQGVIEHTAGSKAIAQVPLLREWIEVSCKYMWASAPHVVTAMEKWPGSQEPNETGFNLLRQTNLPFFAELIKNPAEMKAFADAMSFFQAGPGMEISLILDHYDWSTHQLVVDVGGSHGKFAVELAKRFPSIQCVVQDLPDVIASAPMLPDHTIGERIRFEAHDFFTEQPIKGADVYFMRMILHDWSDRYATLILKNLIPALKPGARVVINDQVVSESGVLSKYAERSVRSFDLAMKEALNAKERDLEDWTRLFEEADATQKRFQVVDVKRPENSFLQIIEVIWNGGES